MPYDPKNPASIFEGMNAFEFACGLNNATALRMGVGGDPTRPDVPLCMAVLGDANYELKRRPAVSVDCRMANCIDCDGEEPAIWPDGEQTIRKCSCPCHTEARRG